MPGPGSPDTQDDNNNKTEEQPQAVQGEHTVRHAPHIASHALAHIHAQPATLVRTSVHSYGGAARPASVAPTTPFTSMSARAEVDSYGAIPVGRSTDSASDRRRHPDVASRVTMDSYGAVATLCDKRMSTRQPHPFTSMDARAEVDSYGAISVSRSTDSALDQRKHPDVALRVATDSYGAVATLCDKRMSTRHLSPLTPMGARARLDSYGATMASHTTGVELDQRRSLDVALRATVDSHGAIVALCDRKKLTQQPSTLVTKGAPTSIDSYGVDKASRSQHAERDLRKDLDDASRAAMDSYRATVALRDKKTLTHSLCPLTSVGVLTTDASHRGTVTSRSADVKWDSCESTEATLRAAEYSDGISAALRRDSSQAVLPVHWRARAEATPSGGAETPELEDGWGGHVTRVDTPFMSGSSNISTRAAGRTSAAPRNDGALAQNLDPSGERPTTISRVETGACPLDKGRDNPTSTNPMCEGSEERTNFSCKHLVTSQVNDGFTLPLASKAECSVAPQAEDATLCRLREYSEDEGLSNNCGPDGLISKRNEEPSQSPSKRAIAFVRWFDDSMNRSRSWADEDDEEGTLPDPRTLWGRKLAIPLGNAQRANPNRSISQARTAEPGDALSLAAVASALPSVAPSEVPEDGRVIDDHDLIAYQQEESTAEETDKPDPSGGAEADSDETNNSPGSNPDNTDCGARDCPTPQAHFSWVYRFRDGSLSRHWVGREHTAVYYDESGQFRPGWTEYNPATLDAEFAQRQVLLQLEANAQAQGNEQQAPDNEQQTQDARMDGENSTEEDTDAKTEAMDTTAEAADAITTAGPADTTASVAAVIETGDEPVVPAEASPSAAANPAATPDVTMETLAPSLAAVQEALLLTRGLPKDTPEVVQAWEAINAAPTATNGEHLARAVEMSCMRLRRLQT